jgi:hypothetical protein
LKEKYRWLVAGGRFVLREKYYWLVADKLSEHGQECSSGWWWWHDSGGGGGEG